jgi:hypothetical protein
MKQKYIYIYIYIYIYFCVRFLCVFTIIIYKNTMKILFNNDMVFKKYDVMKYLPPIMCFHLVIVFITINQS